MKGRKNIGFSVADPARVHPEETFHRLTVLMSASMPAGC